MRSANALSGAMLLLMLWCLLLVPAALFPQAPSPLVDASLQGEALASALKSLSESARAALVQREKQALTGTLRDGPHLLNLSLLAGLQGDVTQQKKLLSVLLRLSKRDPSVQLTSASFYMSLGNLPAAANAVDALLRVNPELGPHGFALLQSIAMMPGGADAVAKSLQNDPPWRLRFFEFLNDVDRSGVAAFAVQTALKAAGSGFHDPELRGLIVSLLNKGFAEKAYFLWLDALSADELKYAGLLYDGGFERRSRNLFFDWTINRTANVQVTFVPRQDDGENKVLSVELVGSKAATIGIGQILRLPRGKFQLNYKAAAKGLTAESAWVWRVRCFSNQGLLGESAAFTEPLPWTAQRFEIVVPAACPTQELRLEALAAEALSQAQTGTLYFDEFSLVPEQASGG